MMRRALVIALLLGSPAFAQRIADSVQVTVIEVPVTVADRAGNSVRGLTADHFELFVDGDRVPVEYFDSIDLTTIRGATDAGRQKELPAAANRNFVLLFDLANSAPGFVARAQEAARTLVEQQLLAHDVVSIATYTAESGVRMVTGFTRDRALLDEAIASAGETRHFRAADPLLVALPPPSQRTERAHEQRAIEEARERDARASALLDSERRDRIRDQVQSLSALARALDRLRGQKQVILLSEGFDARLVTGRTELSSEEAMRENRAVERGELWNVESESRFGSAGETNAIQAMGEIFRRSDVRLHAIDIRGLRGESDARRGAVKANNEGLFLLTRPAGGTVLANGNDLGAQFSSLLRAQEVLYVLGFTARERSAPGTFHRIAVKLAGRRGEVAHRPGYFAMAPEMTALESTLSLSELMTSDADILEVPQRVVSLSVPGPNGHARVPVIVDISGTSLLEGVEGSTATANVFVYAFDEQRQVRDFVHQKVSVDLPTGGEQVRSQGVRYVTSLSLPAGRYDLRSLVRVDETGRVGLMHETLEVPPFAPAVILTPIATADAAGWTTIVDGPRGETATGILTLGDFAFVPAAHPYVHMGSDQQIVLMVRGLPVEQLTIKPELVHANGGSHPAPLTLVGRTSPDAHGVAKLLFRFSPRDVPQGEYVLRLTVAAPGAEAESVALPVVVVE